MHVMINGTFLYHSFVQSLISSLQFGLVHFSSRCYLHAQERPYVLHPFILKVWQSSSRIPVWVHPLIHHWSSWAFILPFLSSTHPFIRSVIHPSLSFIHSSIHQVGHSSFPFSHPLIHSSRRSFILPFLSSTHPFIRSVIHPSLSFIQPFIHPWWVHLFICIISSIIHHSFIHSHSSVCSFIHLFSLFIYR